MSNDQPEDYYIEHWTLVLNHEEYAVSQEQAQLLKQQIKNGNRGIVMFPAFAVNIPMIQEFYLDKRTVNPKYVLPETHVAEEYQPISEEEQRQLDQKRAEIKESFKQKLKEQKSMSPKQFEQRRKQLLEQAETLKKD